MGILWNALLLLGSAGKVALSSNSRNARPHTAGLRSRRAKEKCGPGTVCGVSTDGAIASDGIASDGIASDGIAAESATFSKSVASANLPSQAPEGGLQVVASEHGRVELSIHGVGHKGVGNVNVFKPKDEATVLGAYLFTALFGSDTKPVILLDGTQAGPPWADATILQFRTDTYFYSYYSEVTSIVKPILDGKNRGEYSLEVTQSNMVDRVQGEILAVIFEAPDLPDDRSVSLLFGALRPGGDSFSLQFDSPIERENLDDPDLKVDFSVGISHGLQTESRTGQFSTIDVNGQRLTSYAGGADDGADEFGQRITVGDYDDSNSNPTDPNGRKADDELYSLVPFLKEGDTSVFVETNNPSNNDFIFFSGLFSTIPFIRPSSSPSTSSSPSVSDRPSPKPSTSPSFQPSGNPSSRPSAVPSGRPSSRPSLRPSGQPSSRPSSSPSEAPSMTPSGSPSASHAPSGRPSEVPSASDWPTSQPSESPSASNSPSISSGPSGQPSKSPSTSSSPSASEAPSTMPSGSPSTSLAPSGRPSEVPSASNWPTSNPSSMPSKRPSENPSISSRPSGRPSGSPSSSDWPTSQPSEAPSASNSPSISSGPSGQPSKSPSTSSSPSVSNRPSPTPSLSPSFRPSGNPSSRPSAFPSGRPSSRPSLRPSGQPSSRPSSSPSESPSTTPSGSPSASHAPSGQPSEVPSASDWPTSEPSSRPSGRPSTEPSVSSMPNVQPSGSPSASERPSPNPSHRPSNAPSLRPSADPSSSHKPSAQPSGHPSKSAGPTPQPSGSPSESDVPSSGPSPTRTYQVITNPGSVSINGAICDGTPEEIQSFAKGFVAEMEETACEGSCDGGTDASLENVVVCGQPYSPDENDARRRLQGGAWMASYDLVTTILCQSIGCEGQQDRVEAIAIADKIEAIIRTSIESGDFTAKLQSNADVAASLPNFDISCLTAWGTMNEATTTLTDVFGDPVMDVDVPDLPYYPNWEGFSGTCLRDGNQPLFMMNSPSDYLFDSLETCCDKHYAGWNHPLCMNNKGSGLWFVDYLLGKCRTDCPEGNGGTCGGVANPMSDDLYVSPIDCCRNQLHWVSPEWCEADSLDIDCYCGTGKYYRGGAGEVCVRDCDTSCSGGDLTCGGIVSRTNVQLHETASECCAEHYDWIENELCTGRTIASDIDKYWPDKVKSKCFKDSEAPAIDLSVPLFSTLEECCAEIPWVELSDCA